MTIQDFLTSVCQHSGIEPESVTLVEDEAAQTITAEIKVSEADSGLLIGFHGDTLSSLQRLARIAFQDQLQNKRLFINVNNYRQQREEKVKDMVRLSAQKVLETGRPHMFTHLPANERFIIHSTLSQMPEFSELESVSEGEGMNRVLTIRLKSAA